jgi:YidC/Oxa1 family membrane protein insertase
MNKKIIFMVMMLFLVFTLAACNRTDDTIVEVVVNDSIGDKLVYNEGQEINVKNEGGVSYWKITKDGAGELVEFDFNINTPAVPGVQTYTFIVSEEEIEASFQFYVIPSDLDTNDPSATDLMMLAFRFEKENILYKQGESFNPTGITIYAVQRNGVIIPLAGEDYVDNFDTNGYTPLGDNGFRDKIAYTVTFSYEGIERDFNVYVAGGERPISSDDATFFDWILVIPVAFVMNFFAALLGNSFALGILFTTIVVRTLAWPIYAKSNDLSIKMNVAQPDMQRVQAKYATKKDPQSQQMMQMELLQVYKKHGINIMGCLFPFLQMPIFIAMYGVVRRITLEGGMYASSVDNTMFLGIDLAKGSEPIASGILAAIVGVTMYFLQKISMKKPSYVKNTAKHNPNPQAMQTEKTMKFVSYFMIIIMVFASYSSNALALYWVFGNLYSLGQTLVNRKLNEKKHENLTQKQLMG